MMRKPDNRQQRRTRQAIMNAFTSLIRDRGYEQLTVSDIADRANVGRTTFYRYFQNKIQILVELHQRRFEKLDIIPDTRDNWFSDTPNTNLVNLLSRFQHHGRFVSFMYQIGSDITYVQYLIENALTQHFAKKLIAAFSEDELTVPIPILARSLAGMFSSMLRWWVQDAPDFTPEIMSDHIMQAMRAVVKDALVSHPINPDYLEHS